METVFCAFCADPVSLDTDHVEIEAAHIPRTEFANLDEYVAHTDCWRDATAEWTDPA